MSVLDAPIVVISNDLIQSQLYENVTLECSVSSRPMARIYWEKNGQIIVDNRMNIIAINQTMSRSRLKIQVGRKEHVLTSLTKLNR